MRASAKRRRVRWAGGTALALACAVACATDPVLQGLDAFHGGHVLLEESQRAGHIVIEPGSEFDPFHGNGRTCGTCHVAQDRFGMSKATRDSLGPDDPFFYDGLDEDQRLLHDYGLVHVISDGLDEFRPTPRLDRLCKVCDEDGLCDPLGLNGDRTRSLHAFTAAAIINHSAKTPRRAPNRDFVMPDAEEIDHLVQYMLSDLVCSQDE